jgi:hypothetical protein
MPAARYTRLNIYVRDPDLRRRVKAAAARRDLSVSDYCLRAISAQLASDGEGRAGSARSGGGGSAPVSRARRFQRSTFKGRLFTVGSAELIAESRRRRGARS